MWRMSWSEALHLTKYELLLVRGRAGARYTLLLHHAVNQSMQERLFKYSRLHCEHVCKMACAACCKRALPCLLYSGPALLLTK